MPRICVIDIGGTNFRSGVYHKGDVTDATIQKSKTPNFLDSLDDEVITKRLIDQIVNAYLFQKHTFPGIQSLGISFPGPVDSTGTVIQCSVIFGHLLNTPLLLRDLINAEFECRRIEAPNIFITNDITASAWRYSDSGWDPYCLITVSSGVGNKIFLGGNVLIGENGLAGELGHVKAECESYSIPCSCGSGINHIGMISSGRGIEFFSKEFSRDGGRYHELFLNSQLAKKIHSDYSQITNQLISEFADAQDDFARSVIEFCTRPLAHAVCTLALSLYIKRFVLIGGFALNCDYYREALVSNVIDRGVYNFKEEDIREMIIYGVKDYKHALIGLGKMIEKSHNC